MRDFKSLGLGEPLLKALNDADYASPTPIQTQAIPPIVGCCDVLGIAQTGTGKTAAFALPVLQRLHDERRATPRNGCRALVLAPTRELALQIAESFRGYARHLDFKVATVFGGVSPRSQRKALAAGIDVLVATPGRLLDHLTSGTADLARTEILVLDEADQMLDLGFLPPLRRIIAKLPKRRQTLLFSATMPTAVDKLATAFLNEPKRISVAPVGTTADRVNQRVIHVGRMQKRAVLARLVTENERPRTLVFTRTKRGADRVANHLEGQGVRVAAIHGNKSQSQRERVLRSFRKARIDILVATDIAARGIDIAAVEHVINFDLPDVPEAYVHRIGRTARAGASGQATSLCDESERKQLRAIEALTRQKIKAEFHKPEGAPPPPRTTNETERDATSGLRRRKRRSTSPSPPAPERRNAQDPGRETSARKTSRQKPADGRRSRRSGRPKPAGTQRRRATA